MKAIKWEMVWLYHRVKQWFVKPTCSFCELSCTPQYGGLCELCDQHPVAEGNVSKSELPRTLKQKEG